MAFCVSQALIATGASVTQKAWAITSLEQRHWRKRSHVPELPHPEILHPGMLTPLPLFHMAGCMFGCNSLHLSSISPPTM